MEMFLFHVHFLKTVNKTAIKQCENGKMVTGKWRLAVCFFVTYCNLQVTCTCACVHVKIHECTCMCVLAIVNNTSGNVRVYMSFYFLVST